MGSVDWLPAWGLPVDNQPHEPLFLTSHGSMEAFKLGQELRGRYGFTPGGSNFTIWSVSYLKNAVSSSSYLELHRSFTCSYLSQGNYLTAPTLNRTYVVSDL